MDTAWSLKSELQDADAALCRAINMAKRLGLPQTADEIDKARCQVDGVLFEIEQRRVPELAHLEK